MKELVVLKIEGGIGKNVAGTCVIKELKKKYKKIVIFASYPQVFENLVDRTLPLEFPFGYEDFYSKADDIFFLEPYRINDFWKQRISLMEAFCRTCEIEYTDKIHSELFFNQQEIALANSIKNDVGNYIVVQFCGGIPPNPSEIPKKFMAKDYPIELAEEFVKKFKAKYPNIAILNFNYSHEYRIKDTVIINAPTKSWFKIMGNALSSVMIDSSGQHASFAQNKKIVSLWMATNPKTFGYNYHTNLEGDCDLNNPRCQRPYFGNLSSDITTAGIWECPTKLCSKTIYPDKIIDNISEILGEPKLYKDVTSKIDLSKVVYQKTEAYVTTLLNQTQTIEQTKDCPECKK